MAAGELIEDVAGGTIVVWNIPGSLLSSKGTMYIRFLYFFITVSYPGGANSLYDGAGVGGAMTGMSSGLLLRLLHTLSEQTMTTKNSISSRKVEKYQIIVIKSILKYSSEVKISVVKIYFCKREKMRKC